VWASSLRPAFLLFAASYFMGVSSCTPKYFSQDPIIFVKDYFTHFKNNLWIILLFRMFLKHISVTHFMNSGYIILEVKKMFQEMIFQNGLFSFGSPIPETSLLTQHLKFWNDTKLSKNNLGVSNSVGVQEQMLLFYICKLGVEKIADTFLSQIFSVLPHAIYIYTAKLT